jgi:uncharacterized membrane protein YhhN
MQPTSSRRALTAAVPFLPFLLVALVHLYSLLVSADGVGTFTKPLLMPVLLIGVLFALPRRRSRVGLLMTVALVFSWLGDVSLLGSGTGGFLTGLAFFLLAHVAYLVLFAGPRSRRRLHPRMLAYFVWWVALVLVLTPHLGVLLVPVAVYGLVLGAMAASALGCGRWIAVGAALFLISDTVLGLNRFFPGFALPEVDFVIMLTYLSGQALIAWGVVLIARTESVTRADSAGSPPPAIRR